ncbi:MAG: DUF2635 domain-containing protein [bacterium]|nr:DUF2635 domain-containing protein [bacterium]
MRRETILVVPREGLRVRDPNNGGAVLPPEGAAVERSSYWIRRQRCGDVCITRDLEEEE